MREGTVPAGSPAPRQQEATQEQEAGQQHPEAVPLLEPRDGLPPLVTTASALAEAVAALGAGEGPVAVDAERASGYRYGQRAFLVQLRRRGAGTVLIDPIACPDLSALDAALAGTEAVLHAASQDLPCLAELGYRPRQLFDTELAGRLLGYPRVGLGMLVETVLGFTLEKGHAAADWSTRPLPTEWLRYAALDVEVLVELRDALAAELAEQGKTEWARQEFAAVLAAEPPPPRPDPWRRTSGIHRVHTRRGMAVVRELWLERDKIARRRDLSPAGCCPTRRSWRPRWRRRAPRRTWWRSCLGRAPMRRQTRPGCRPSPWPSLPDEASRSRRRRTGCGPVVGRPRAAAAARLAPPSRGGNTPTSTAAGREPARRHRPAADLGPAPTPTPRSWRILRAHGAAVAGRPTAEVLATALVPRSPTRPVAPAGSAIRQGSCCVTRPRSA
jgi:hypothetical protein